MSTKPTRRPSQARSQVTFDAILEGASQVLRKEGLARASTTRIAKRAGVSVGTLYQYFPNKEAVFAELISRLLAERREARRTVLAALPPPTDLGSTMSWLLDQLFATHLADPVLHRELHRYEAAAGFDRLEQYQNELFTLVEGALERHADKLRPLDRPLAARMLVLSVIGVLERLSREDPMVLERPDVKREVAALIAGYLSPLNPVVLMAAQGG